MGLHVNIYKQDRTDSWLGDVDCTNGGMSSKVKGFTVTNCNGPFEPCEDYPAAQILKQKFGFGCSLKLVPEVELEKESWTMFGGNFASTSDSRFGEACRKSMGDDAGNVFSFGPLQIHDRVE